MTYEYILLLQIILTEINEFTSGIIWGNVAFIIRIIAQNDELIREPVVVFRS